MRNWLERLDKLRVLSYLAAGDAKLEQKSLATAHFAGEFQLASGEICRLVFFDPLPAAASPEQKNKNENNVPRYALIRTLGGEELSAVVDGADVSDITRAAQSW